MDNVQAILNSINESPNPNSVLNFKYYSEEGIKELTELAKVIEKISKVLSVEELSFIVNVIDSYERSDLLLYKMLERKIEMIEYPNNDFTKPRIRKSMGANLKPLQHELL